MEYQKRVIFKPQVEKTLKKSEILIYHVVWDGKNGSHDLLKLAITDFLKRQGMEMPEAFTIIQESSGSKPYWQEMPGVQFSISHSDTIWMCAVGWQEIGFDVQKNEVHKAERLAKRFFHEDEVEWLYVHGFETEFCRIWAYKESYLKYTGVGLAKGMDYFSVVPALSGNPLDGGICQQEISLEEESSETYYAVLTTSEQTDRQLIKLSSFKTL